MTNIFISFSPKDQKFVAEARERLLRAKFKPWIDPSPRPGQDWRLDIDKAIRASDLVIVIVSPASAESVYVTYEWTLALALEIPVVRLIFKDADVHPRLQMVEHFDISGFRDAEHFWDYFLRELERYSGVTGALRSPQKAAPSTEFIRVQMPRERGHWLVVRRGPNLNEMFRIDKDLVTLGRDPANDITIDDPEVSRFHLRLTRRTDSFYMVEDVGSTNGTFIQNRRMEQPYALKPGTSMRLGDSVILTYEVVR